ncbi:hypothetical protein L1049_011166 [Liquidambar formosana]|uniref:C2 NT-type domain-containing protein n=1 Tax=Liquidambar formosana TaxID=63359 RepID=A0AAP0WZK1_LIQFO
MVVNMMKWRPWPPLSSKKFEAGLVLRRLEGLDSAQSEGKLLEDLTKLVVEVKWKGSKSIALSSLRRRRVRRNFTKEGGVTENGTVEWNEEFRSVCNFSAYKECVFHPWEVTFTVFNGLNQGPKNKVPVVGTASLNLAEFASAAQEKEVEINVPLTLPAGSIECSPSLCLSLSLLELRTTLEPSETVQGCLMPIPLSPRSVETSSTEKDEQKDELSALKAGLRKVKIFKEYMSARRAKKACREEEGSDGRCSVRSMDGEYSYPFDTDSLDDFDEGESEESKEDSCVRKSFSYGTLTYANWAGGSFYSNTISSGEDEDWIYYSNRKPDVGCLHVGHSTASVPEQPLRQSSKRRILSWRKRKVSFRSPKAKGEPLLKKDYGEEGGDDIDFDRRQLSSSDESRFGWCKTEDDSTANRSSVSEFGDDNFAVGSWENKEVISRDGHMKLKAQLFFASIDQRSERAAGESACTALVAVIADWVQSNRGEMPIKSQFDSLIREGSLEWRNLCENEAYRERFPDKHFDLDTVLQAKVRPLSIVPEKSFIGFFHPEGLEEGSFDFLHGAMSFDSIWDEINRHGSDCPVNGDPLVYIVSWNDHFFVLKVEQDAYYIIDTLGERLYEGCNQAYVLKFDKDTTIQQLPDETRASDEKPASDKVQPNNSKEAIAEETQITPNQSDKIEREEPIVCSGKESCKEYIKSFLAAIPIRELQADIKKGLIASTPLHRRLQIEFHYTKFLWPVTEYPVVEALADAPSVAVLAVA